MSAEHIVQIFRRVLKTPDVDENADFFELGGDSLLATRVLSAIARELGPELTYDDIVENPTAGGLFDLIAVMSS